MLLLKEDKVLVLWIDIAMAMAMAAVTKSTFIHWRLIDGKIRKPTPAIRSPTFPVIELDPVQIRDQKT